MTGDGDEVSDHAEHDQGPMAMTAENMLTPGAYGVSPLDVKRFEFAYEPEYWEPWLDKVPLLIHGARQFGIDAIRGVLERGDWRPEERERVMDALATVVEEWPGLTKP